MNEDQNFNADNNTTVNQLEPIQDPFPLSTWTPGSPSPDSSPPLSSYQFTATVLHASADQLQAEINNILNESSQACEDGESLEVADLGPDTPIHGQTHPYPDLDNIITPQAPSYTPSPKMTLAYQLKSNSTSPNRPSHSRRSLGIPDRSLPSPLPAPESPVATTIASPFLLQQRFEKLSFDRPSLSIQKFLQSLNPRERRYVEDASASGEFVLNERRTRMVVEDGVAIRDFAFEAWARMTPGAKKAVKNRNMGVEEEELWEENLPMEGKGPKKGVEKQPIAMDAPPPQKVKNSLPREEKSDGMMDKGKNLTSREQSFKNLYGSYGYRDKLEEKENEKKESSDDEDGNEKLSFARKNR